MNCEPGCLTTGHEPIKMTVYAEHAATITISNVTSEGGREVAGSPLAPGRTDIVVSDYSVYSDEPGVHYVVFRFVTSAGVSQDRYVHLCGTP